MSGFSRRIRQLFSVAALLASTFWIVSCGGSTSQTTTTASPTLVSITVTPATSSIGVNSTQQFAATGNFSNGSTQDLTAVATWSSSNASVATIGNSAGSQGLASAVGLGTASITASSGPVSGTASLTVNAVAPTLVSIVIGPPSPTISIGATQPFSATGSYSDGSTQVITSSVTWSSSNTAVATVSNNTGTQGVATGIAAGTATITATSGSVSATDILTVSAGAPTLVSIAVSPVSPTISVGAAEQFTATGTYSDGSTQNITSAVSWSSVTTSVATISNAAGTQGVATGVSAGTSTILASLGAFGGETTLTVTAATLVSIAVLPQGASITAGTSQPFTATGTYSDNTTQPITTSVTWSSSKSSIATISNTAGTQGLAAGVAAGTTTITAASGSISGSATLTVTAATLVSISVSPQSSTIAAGAKQQFAATGTYSDGSTQTITSTVTWNSSATGVATISNAAGTQGLASGVAAGTANITATSGSVSGAASLTVTAVTLTSITVSPPSPTISTGATQQFTAAGTYSDGSTQSITDSVTWTSGTTSIATISNSSGSQGLATGIAAGASTITATLGVAGSATLTVTAAVSSQSWTLHGPPGRHSHTAVWDPNSRQMIIFGGEDTITNTALNDVWLGQTSTTQDDSFTGESPSGTAPQPRYGHVATYASASNRMTIFGGGTGTGPTCLNDAWILNGANGQSGTPDWIAMTPSGTPPVARIYSGAAYDPNTNVMMVFGGSDCSTGYFNDVWILSDADGESGTPAWTQLNPSGTPPAARESGSAIYDSTNNILTIYGGDAGGNPFGDVWTLSHANGTGGTPTWTQLSPTGTAPAARTGQTATYDSSSDRMTIFGGTANGTTFTDSWVLTSANGIGTPSWIQLVPPSTAPSVAYHSAVYDPVSDNMYIFAGTSSEDKLDTNDHAFTLSAANGIPTSGLKWTLGGPPVRYGQSAFYDSSINSLFVFAGQHAQSAVIFNDYWQASNVLGSSNLSWSTLDTNGSRPSPRFGHTGLYDSSSNHMMVFGGATGFPTPCVNDYYVLENADAVGATPTWLSISTATAPAIRALQASVYDSATNTLIIFGGWNCSSTYYNDVWILSDANDQSGQPAWTQLSPTGTPPSAREASSAIYDSSTNTLTVYGGDAGGLPFGDIWILSNANGSGGTPAWTQLNPSNSGPGARSGHTATYDSANNLMMIYGGYNGTSILGDTWVLSAANGSGGTPAWTQTSTGPIRRFHSSEYDPSSNQMITYGGATAISPQVPTSDMYSLTDANGIP